MGVKQGALGEAIRAARLKKGYTQEYLSEKLNITPGHLQHMESERRKPSVPMLFQMMELLDFSVDALVFPEHQKEESILRTDGLSQEEREALAVIIRAMR